MNTEQQTIDPVPNAPSGHGWRRWPGWPVMVLLVVSPTIAELAWGTTVLSTMGGFVLYLGLYGCGALLVRELVRRAHRGWPSILLLGVVFAILEEGIAEPTWLTPGMFPHPAAYWAHANWAYAGFNAGYHAVWSIALPIALTEIAFPTRRGRPWLGRTGTIVTTAVYAVSVAAAAAIFYRLGPSLYHVAMRPRPLMLLLAVVGALIAVAALRFVPKPTPGTGQAPRARSVGLVGLLSSAAWFVLLDISAAGGQLPAAGPLTLLTELAVPVVAGALIWRWSTATGWSERHRLALIAGLAVPQMIPGFLYHWPTTMPDIAFKAAVNAATLAMIALLARRSRRRTTPS